MQSFYEEDEVDSHESLTNTPTRRNYLSHRKHIGFLKRQYSNGEIFLSVNLSAKPIFNKSEGICVVPTLKRNYKISTASHLNTIIIIYFWKMVINAASDSQCLFYAIMKEKFFSDVKGYWEERKKKKRQFFLLYYLVVFIIERTFAVKIITCLAVLVWPK